MNRLCLHNTHKSTKSKRWISSVSIVLCIFFSISVNGQRSVTDADKLFNSNQFGKARDAYAELVKLKPNQSLYHYRLGRCYYELGDYTKALEQFQLSSDKYPSKDFYYGEIFFDTYHFDEAVKAYQKYLNSIPADGKEALLLKNKIHRSELAAKMLERVDDIVIVDSMKIDKSKFLQHYNLPPDLGSLEQSFVQIKNNKKYDKITYTTQRQDRKYFTDTINSQLDIFTSYKLMDEWSAPTALPDQINTPANENYPFLMADGITLFYASEGENSIGGYDIFMTRYNPATNSYLNPENIGMPYNSPANDYMMAIDEQHHVGWFATDRYQSKNKVVIYKFIPNDTKTILRSTDIDSIIPSAQLKKFKTNHLENTDTSMSGNETSDNERSKILFVVNDSISYTSKQQFRSDVALKLFEQYQKNESEIQILTKQLGKLRDKYHNLNDETTTTKLSTDIIRLESEIASKKDQLSASALEIRNTEIKKITK